MLSHYNFSITNNHNYVYTRFLTQVDVALLLQFLQHSCPFAPVPRHLLPLRDLQGNHTVH